MANGQQQTCSLFKIQLNKYILVQLLAFYGPRAQLCCFYFEKEALIVYVWTHVLAYM